MDAKYQVLRAALAANVPALLWGPPGVGKTAVLAAIADLDGRHLEVVIASVRDQTDFNGIPVVQPDGTVVRSPDDWVHNVCNNANPLLFLDEIGSVPPSVQAACLSVVSERRAGQVRLPDELRIVAAANEADVAADGFELAAPMANRFLHLEWGLDVDAYHQGLLAGFDTVAPTDRDCRIITNPGDDRLIAMKMKVIAFHQVKPGLIQNLPNDPTKAGKAWPSSRTWTYLAHVMAHLPDDATSAILLAARGLVGEGAALEFTTFLLNHDLPTPEQVLADPSIVDWKGRADRIHTILAGVAGYAQAKGTKGVWTKAMKLMAAAAKAGRTDAAAPIVSRLYATRPEGVVPSPTQLAPFLPTLQAAGLLDSTLQVA